MTRTPEVLRSNFSKPVCCERFNYEIKKPLALDCRARYRHLHAGPTGQRSREKGQRQLQPRPEVRTAAAMGESRAGIHSGRRGGSVECGLSTALSPRPF